MVAPFEKAESAAAAAGIASKLDRGEGDFGEVVGAEAAAAEAGAAACRWVAVMAEKDASPEAELEEENGASVLEIRCRVAA